MTTVTARLDVNTWELQEGPPASADPHADRQADRCFTLGQAAAWAATGFCGAFPFAPLVGGIGALISAAIALAAWKHHRHLRQRTGVPVVAALRDLMHSYVILTESERELTRTVRQSHPEDAVVQQEADDFEASLVQEQQTLARLLISRCELAAQADRRGWKRLHDRHAKRLHETMLPLLKRLTLFAPPEAASEDTAADT